jgi:hypothetical protein
MLTLYSTHTHSNFGLAVAISRDKGRYEVGNIGRPTQQGYEEQPDARGYTSIDKSPLFLPDSCAPAKEHVALASTMVLNCVAFSEGS